MLFPGRPLCGVAASLTALASLSACGAHTGKPPTMSSSQAATTAAVAGTTTAAVAAPRSGEGPRREKWIDLQVGDCLAEPPPSDPSVVTVTIVDCATAHQAEVYYRAAVGVNAAVADVANRECTLGFSQYTGQAIDGSPFAVTYLIDSNQDRTSFDPTPSSVICLLQAANGQPLMQSAHR